MVDKTPGEVTPDWSLDKLLSYIHLTNDNAGGQSQRGQIADFAQHNVLIINSAADFPDPTDPDPAIGVIQLDADVRYVITGQVTFDYPIQFGVNSVISGGSARLDQLVFTGTARSGFIGDGQSVLMDNLFYVAPTADGFLKTGVGSFILFNVSMSVQNFGSLETDGDILINGGVLFFAGTGIVLTAGQPNPFFGIAEARVTNATTGDTLIDYRGTTIDSILIRDVNFVPLGGGPVISGDANNANIGTSADIHACLFSGGLGQILLVGATVADSRYLFNNNIGIEQSVVLGSALLAGNATQTTINVQSQLTPIGGLFAAGAFDQRTLVQGGGGRIDNLSNRSVIGDIKAAGSIDNLGGGTQTFRFQFRKNGAPLGGYMIDVNVDGNDQNSFIVFGNVELGPSEFIDVVVSNETGIQNCLIGNMQFILQAR